MSFIAHNMAPLMFGGMILFMLIGYPAAFSLAATGLFFGFLGIELGLIRPDFLGNLTYQLFGIISNDLLLAIPFFTFMGAILERCGLAEDLLDSIGQLFGPVRGGMSYAVIFVGAILGAITGTVAASVIAMGVISMVPMLKYGYSTRHTMGVIAASGTITQLIPPPWCWWCWPTCSAARSATCMPAPSDQALSKSPCSVLGSPSSACCGQRTCRPCRWRRARSVARRSGSSACAA
jgi:TRAP-type mannitol/chloroaromatic compound transport system permease large subunit